MTADSERSPSVKSVAPRPGRISLPIDIWRRRLLITLVVSYAAILILAPIAALISGAFAEGIGGSLSALSQPDVISAFKLTLSIAVITVIVHAVFGTTLAWVLVR